VKILAEQIWNELKDRLGNLILLTAADSSHDMALRLIEQMDNEEMALAPTLFLVQRQGHGHGRAGRSWSSPRGGLYLSWLCSGLTAEQIAQMPMLSAAAAFTAVSELGIAGLRIKWPNDLLIAGKKLAGLLVHARQSEMTWLTVGLGVNLEQVPELDGPALHPPTALAEHLPLRQWREWAYEITTSFVNQLHANLEAPGTAIAYWREHLVHQPGESMTVRLGSGDLEQGAFAGLTEEGFLRLATASGEQVITSGDVVETG
jgi:BirA family biotin operon repressor/biotin-[acetyl-CoA-carboxylase] ligase